MTLECIGGHSQKIQKHRVFVLPYDMDHAEGRLEFYSGMRETQVRVRCFVLSFPGEMSNEQIRKEVEERLHNHEIYLIELVDD